MASLGLVREAVEPVRNTGQHPRPLLQEDLAPLGVAPSALPGCVLVARILPRTYVRMDEWCRVHEYASQLVQRLRAQEPGARSPRCSKAPPGDPSAQVLPRTLAEELTYRAPRRDRAGATHARRHHRARHTAGHRAARLRVSGSICWTRSLRFRCRSSESTPEASRRCRGVWATSYTRRTRSPRGTCE